MADWEVSQLSVKPVPAASTDYLPILDTTDHSTAPAGAGGSDKRSTVQAVVQAGFALAPSGDTSGATDTPAIQALLNSAGPVRLQAGTFWISNMLQVKSGTCLSGAGKGVTTIKMASGSWSGVSQVNGINGAGALITYGNTTASYITIRDLTVDGNLTGITALPSWATGGTAAGDNVTNSPLHLNDVTSLLIEDVEVINPIGYTVYLQSCTQFTVRDCRVVSGQVSASQSWGLPSQQDGIHLDGCSYGLVDGNYIDTGTSTTDVGDDGIALQSLSGACNDITISGNRIRSAEAGVDLALSGNDIYDIAVTGNDIWSTQGPGIVSHPFTGTTSLSRNITVTGNTLTANCASTGLAAISFLDYSEIVGTPGKAWDGVTIAGNVIQGMHNSGAYGIYGRYGANLTVTGNTVRDFEGLVGITVGDNVAGSSLPVTQFAVAANTVDMSATSASGCVGVLLYDSGTGSVMGNTLIGPGGNSSDRIGISPTQASNTNLCQYVNITNNTVSGWDYGIQEFNAGGGNPDNNNYSGNIFESCTQFLALLGPHSLIADVEQFAALASAYTLTNSTSAQKLFNASTNGTLTVQGSTTYFFECEFDVTGLSSSSHTMEFGFGGTATFTSLKYVADSNTGAAGTLAAWQTIVVTSASATALMAAGTTTTFQARLRGILRVNAAGTIIPQVTQLTAAAAADVGVNSWFRIWPTAGSNTAATVGNWS